MERKNYTVAVDLGSSSVVVAVGSKGAEGTLDVACVVSKPVEGVHAGKIENIELVSRAIREAVEEVQEQLGIRITEAYAGISGDFVRCARHTDHVFVYDPQNGVNRKDVDALFDRMRNVQAPDDETIMERVPQNYMVDDSQEVRNPVGSFGKKLSSTFNFILCLRTPIQRLEMALKRLGIKMLGVVPGALASSEAVLLPDEKEEGAAVVDIGAGVTDVAVYYRNVVRYIASIPMGASAINRDIRTMSVPEKHVESLKQKYGSAVAELASDEKLIRVNGRTAREAKDILLRNLATVIEARATDIAEFVLQEIRDSGYDGKLAYGIVLTGGRTGRLRLRRAAAVAGGRVCCRRTAAPVRSRTAVAARARVPACAAPSASGRGAGCRCGRTGSGGGDRRAAGAVGGASGVRSAPAQARLGLDLPEDVRQDQQEFLGGRGRGDLGRIRSSAFRSKSRLNPRLRRGKFPPRRGVWGRAGFVNAAETRLPAGEKG